MEYPLAIAEFNKILDNMLPDDANYLRIKYELAEAYMSSNDFGKALETFTEINERDPEFRDVSDKIQTLKEDHETPEPSLQEAEISMEEQSDDVFRRNGLRRSFTPTRD
jgi:tetratricopeptide (TPR) repeat protein